MKYNNIEAKNIPTNTTYTNFVPEIKDWFNTRISLEKSRRKGKQTTSHNKERNHSGAKKQRMLENIIFPSLFNLITFFECIENDYRMKKLFQKDFVRFIGMDGIQQIKKAKSTPDELNVFKYKRNNFSRLLLAMINSLDPNLKPVKLDEKIFYAFLYQLQDIIGRTASISLKQKFGIESNFSNDAKNTFFKSIDLLAAMSVNYDDKLQYGDLSYWNVEKD